jgi:hypothetical protein
MEANYDGIYRGKHHINDSLCSAARLCYPGDMPRREALRFMLIIACDPASIDKSWRKDLKRHGWRTSQIRAMAPFAAFHASRIITEWQASAFRCTQQEADKDDIWQPMAPPEELWSGVAYQAVGCI